MGTRIPGGWEFTTAQRLPINQNHFIRARGFYGTGMREGSASVVESVRNVYLTAPFQIATAASRETHGGAGVFDVRLPLTGEPGVECRSGTPASDAHTLVFTFTNNVVSGNASVTTGTGVVSGSPTFAGNA